MSIPLDRLKTKFFFNLLRQLQSNYFEKKPNNHFIFIEKYKKNFREKNDLVLGH